MTTSQAQELDRTLDDIGVDDPQARVACTQFVDRILRENPGIDPEHVEVMVECYCRGWEDKNYN